RHRRSFLMSEFASKGCIATSLHLRHKRFIVPSARTQHVRRTRTNSKKTEPIPKALRVFAWNLDGALTTFAKKQIALNVIERGRAWHWSKLPKGWFDLEFCLAHGQKKTKRALRELFSTKP